MTTLQYPAVDVATVFSPYIYDSYSRNARTMFTGQGWRTPAQAIAVVSGQEYSVYDKVYVSPDYWTSNPRFLLNNFYQASTQTPTSVEVNCGNVQQIVAMSLRLGLGVSTPTPLLFGGSATYSIPDGGSIWNDKPTNFDIPPRSIVVVRYCIYNPIGAFRCATDFSRAIARSVGERIQYSSSDISGLVTSGAALANAGGYPFEIAAAVADGWDGVTPVAFIPFGTSIEYGQGEGTQNRDQWGESGPLGRGLAKSASGSPRIPHVNWSRPGAYAASVNATGDGFTKRLAAIAALGLSYDPFTVMIAGGPTNDAAAFSSWSTIANNMAIGLKTLWPKSRLVQSTMYPRTSSTDAFTTVANQSAQNSFWTYNTGDAWQLRSYILQFPQANPALDGVFDVIPGACGLSSGGTIGKWYDPLTEQWSTTLSASVAIAAKTTTLPILIQAADIISIVDGSPEAVIAISTSGTASPYSEFAFTGWVSAHTSGATVKRGILPDGTHPSALVNSRLATEIFVPLKQAGVFG